MSGTGEGKRQLVDGIKSDLSRIRGECESLSRECEKIHEEAKGLNGWPAVWKGVSQLLTQAAAQLHEAERGDLKKLQGSVSSQIISDLNHSHAEAVKSARGLEPGPGGEPVNGSGAEAANGVGADVDGAEEGGSAEQGATSTGNGGPPRGTSEKGEKEEGGQPDDSNRSSENGRARLLVPS